MERFILRYKGSGRKPEEDVRRIRSVPNTTVLDDTPRMLLVSGPESNLRSLVQSMSDWIMSPERTVNIPKPHPTPARDPDETE
jgi:hypothetical protein